MKENVGEKKMVLLTSFVCEAFSICLMINVLSELRGEGGPNDISVRIILSNC